PAGVRQAQITRLQFEYMKYEWDPKSDPDKKAAAKLKWLMEQQRDGKHAELVKQPKLDLPPDWAATHREVRNAKEAELLVQVGDIDNLGFGWPYNFDPFSGDSTPPHRFPWAPEADDPQGTDKIMVSSAGPFESPIHDGYAQETMRDENQPVPLVIQFDPKGIAIKGAVLQLFVD